MRGAAVTGIDFSMAQLQHAPANFDETGVRFPLVQANGERLPFADDSFDLVFCDHGVMGFADPSLTVPEVARVLRTGWAVRLQRHDAAGSGSRGGTRTTLRPRARCGGTTSTMGSMDVDDPSWRTTEFQLPYGDWIRLFRANGLVDRGPDRAAAPGRRDHDLRRLRAARVGPRVPRGAHLEGPEGVRSEPSGRRSAGAALLALAALVAAVAVSRPAPVRTDDRPNVIVVLTDDQRAGTFARMPWLGSQLARAGSGWTEFPNAFANTPLCCPARASLLTGLYARHTGVLDNGDGHRFDASSTLATWLHDAGYRTGLVGKYLNRYPFGRLAFIPPGWDRFVAKENQTGVTVYRDFHAVDQGSPVFVRRYATDWLAERAIDFVRTAPAARPFFLLFAPSAPHPPWIPAARHEGAFAGLRIEEPPTVVGALRGAPPWVRSLPFPSAAQRATWLDDQRRADETLLAVDEALRGIVTDARRPPRRHGDLRAVGQRLFVRGAPVGRQDVSVRRVRPHPAGGVRTRGAGRC